MAKQAKVKPQIKDAVLKLFRRLNTARLNDSPTRLCVSRVSDPDYTAELIAVFLNGNGRIAGVLLSQAGYIIRALVGVVVCEQSQNDQGEWTGTDVCIIEHDGDVVFSKQ